MEKTEYDAIIIGSGIGGLAAACILTKIAKKKVLVLEQHWEFGGLTHEFQRKSKFSWDVGLHYVGKLKKGSLPSDILHFITEGKLQWNDLPYEFEKFIYPDLTFTVPSDKKEFISKLIQQFPEESKSIRNYFKDLEKAVGYGGRLMVIDLVPKWVGYLIKIYNDRFASLALSTTKEYLDTHFKNPKLKAILVSQWGDYGLPPGKSTFFIHSTIALHYINGAAFPEGGASSIGKQVQRVIEANRGKCLTSMDVKEVIVENGKAKGVRVEQKRGEKSSLFYQAPLVISCTGAKHSYQNLIPSHTPANILKDLEEFPKGKSAVTLYLGLKSDPRSLGFQGENNWIYQSYDHDSLSDKNKDLLLGKPMACYLSFPSLKNHSAKGHTAEIISFAEFAWFENWKDTKWKKRGEEYEELKKTISRGLIDLVSSHYPGFSDLIEFSELSTPLSYIELAGRSNGEFYGIPAIPERYKLKWLGAKTPVKNFYLAGTDVYSLGIVGAMMGGVAAVAHAMEPAGFPKIVSGIKRTK